MKTLTRYLSERKITKKEFADRLGYTESYIRSICNGSFKVGKRIAKQILEETHGEVNLLNECSESDLRKIAEMDWENVQRIKKEDWIRSRMNELKKA